MIWYNSSEEFEQFGLSIICWHVEQKV